MDVNIRNVIYLSLIGLLVACGPTDAELDAQYKAEQDQVEEQRIESEKKIDHKALNLDSNGVLLFKKSKCSIVFPGLKYEGELSYKTNARKTTVTFQNEDGKYVLETILKTPKSDLLRYFNGALVAMDMEYGYSGNDSAKKDTVNGMYRVTYKTNGFSGSQNHGSHRLFYNNGVVYGLYCVNTQSHMNQMLVDSFFDSFEFID